MKILVLCDDKWHPAEVVEKGMAFLTEEGFELDFVKDAKDILTPEMLRRYPLIVNAKGNVLNCGNDAPWFDNGVTEVGPKELKSYVEQGGGFLSIHSGNSFTADECREYTEFVGNSFVTHPARPPNMKYYQEFILNVLGTIDSLGSLESTFVMN